MSQHPGTQHRRRGGQVNLGNRPNEQPAGQDLPNQGDDDDQAGGDNLPNDNAPREQWKQAATALQLSYNEQKQQLAEKSRRIGELESQLGPRKRARQANTHEATPIDRKYLDAGKRCAVMQMIWVTKVMYDIQPSQEFLPEIRYDKNKPEMARQGEKQDILNSMALNLQARFLELPHFQDTFAKGVQEERHNLARRVRRVGSLIMNCRPEKINSSDARKENETFKEHLGYNAQGKTPSERYPCLAPILYAAGFEGNNVYLFRSEQLYQTFRACVFGEGSIQPGSAPQKGQPVLANVLGITGITPGAIAASAILLRYCISPDTEFKQQGNVTKVSWLGSYRS